MQRILGVIAGLTLAAAAAAPAAAQSAADTRAVRFGVYGGLSMPQGDADEMDMGFIVGGSADWRGAAMPVGLRFDAAYQRWGGDVSDISTLMGLGSVVYNIPTQASVAPYLLGGLGIYRFSASDCDEECDQTELGFNVGGGVNFNLGTLQTFVEARYHIVEADDVSLNHLPVVFGIRF